MNQLINRSKNITIANEVLIAKTFTKRAKGLLGHKSFADNKAMWIHRCRDIHTCFMKFPIDAVFVDKSLKVISIHKKLAPWRFAFSRKASSVFEFNAGVITSENVAIGDQLHVDG